MSKRFMPIGAKPEDPSYLAGWLCEPHPVNVRSNNIPIQKQSGGIPPDAAIRRPRCDTQYQTFNETSVLSILARRSPALP
jgi:hypothetical protein